MSVAVSALMSVYNGEAYLAAAIDSVLAQLGPGDELIVVDDGSTDGSGAILGRYAGRITVLAHDNRGLAASLNRAAAAARGELLAFNDADDLWEPGRLAGMRRALDCPPPPDLVFGMSLQFVSPELSDAQKLQFAPPVELMRGEGLACLLVRATTFRRVGVLDEAMRLTAVYDWLGRAKALGLTSVMLPDIVTRRRLHPGNWTRLNRAQLEAESLKALRAQILRRRAAGNGGTPSG